MSSKHGAEGRGTRRREEDEYQTGREKLREQIGCKRWESEKLGLQDKGEELWSYRMNDGDEYKTTRRWLPLRDERLGASSE